MRVIVMFDLPSITTEEKRNYSRFRRFLIKSGFIMMQESVYTKLVLNSTAANTVVANVRKNKPPKGIVQLLSITEKQFSKMEFIVGANNSEVIDNDERIIII